jgi:hypothetical protein
MIRFLVSIALLLLIAFPLPHAKESEGSLAKQIQLLIRQGKGTPAGRAAWDKVVAGGPKVLPLLLCALDTPDTVAANWVRTAFDRIVEQDFKVAKGRGIDAKTLLAFARDANFQGRARRLALEVVDRLQPGTSDRLYPGWLEDPEFRYEAVDVVFKEADALVKAGQKDKAVATYRKAWAAVRDLQQAKRVAVGLLRQGVKVSVADHLGFLRDWYVIGPFDARELKGFAAVYPPEKKIDLAATYQGKGKKVHWKRFQVREPAPSTPGPHVALVNLRESLGDADDAVAYAYTEFTLPRAQSAEFRGGADDNFTVWVNGKKEFGFEEYRNGVRFDRHRFRVNLKAGKNTVLVKICQYLANSEPNWEFLLRVVDETEKGLAIKPALPDKKRQ